MSDKLEFASAVWIAAAEFILGELVALHGEPGTTFSICEAFTDAPETVAPNGVAAWHFYIDGNSVAVGTGEVSDTDVQIRADYQTTLPFARLVYTAEILAQRASEPPQAQSGSLEGDMSKAPPYLVELHNRLAVITA